MDRGKVEFTSDEAIDKIVSQGQISITNPGAQATDSLGINFNVPTYRIVTSTRPNPYGRNAFVRYRWSYDGGTNWNGQGSSMAFGYNLSFRTNGVHQSSDPVADLRAHVAVATSDTQITFRTVSTYHSTSGIYSDTVLSPFKITWGNWSPISQTFIIQYWVYERT